MREGGAVNREKMERNLRRERKLRETIEREIECRRGDAIGIDCERERTGEMGRSREMERVEIEGGIEGRK